MTSERLIGYLDRFSERLEKKTVVVMDQSPVHTSDAVMKKLEEWASKNLLRDILATSLFTRT